MVKLKDIAEAVGVSNTTVSRVLNEDPLLSVSAETRRVILAVASELKYTPRRARGRQTPVGRRVAVLVGEFLGDELEDPYYAGLRLGIEQRCFTLGLNVMITQDSGALDGMLRRKGTGAVVIGPTSSAVQKKLEDTQDRVVLIDPIPPAGALDSVRHDMLAAINSLLDSLWQKGYRRLGFIGGAAKNKEASLLETRHAAFVGWTKERDVHSPSLVSVEGSTIDLGYENAMNLLESGAPPDVIVACTDNMAIGAYKAIAEKGWRTPEDIAVVGFNDNPASEFLHPPLSSVRLAPDVAGTAAVDLLMERLDGRSLAKTILLHPQIKWRQSTR
ncbi:LacI family DNA-binding transcriptional regulator [Bauldia sp.]|uniref:LacI family DNA-binding transcriptional regulator n=1 Tax=Bauldia sp. TaxID=2575872 RepID=UPI003BAD81F8